ncbi:MAG: transcription-repair coupling factor [Actinomycetes bacterium]
MTLDLIAAAVLEDRVITGVVSDITAGVSTRIPVPKSTIPFVVGALASVGRPLVIVAPTERAAEDLVREIRDFVSDDSLAVFPAWETLPHERLSPSSDTVGRRMAVLRRLAHPEDLGPLTVVVTSVRAFIQPIVAGLGEIAPLHVTTGDEFPLEKLVTELARLGFDRVELVDRRGQFAVRGGIVDVFPAAEEHPLRIEFWGDSVEEIRTFSIADQRSLGIAVPKLFATACRELLITDEVKVRAEKLSKLHPELSEILGKVAQGIAAEGMESLIPVLVPKMELLLDVISKSAIIIEVEPERLETRAHELATTSAEFLEASWHNATAGNAIPIDLGASAFRDYQELKETYNSRAWLGLSLLTRPDDEVPDLEPITDYRSNVESFVSDIRTWWKAGYRVVVSMAGHGSTERLVATLLEFDIPARQIDTLTPGLVDRVVEVTVSHQEYGAQLGAAKLAVVTEVDLFGSRDTQRENRSLPSRRRQVIDPLTLKSGDYVVHEQHGVGRYIEMTQRTVQGATREYLVIEYTPSKRGQRGDRLYVPSDQLDQITRYVGGEAPTLNRLGGGDWAATKSKARRAVRQIAGELIRLYAARMASKGYAFGPDTPWQRELEDAFEYVETPDQLATINEVKRDMESEVPMDRLVCGDVGYGKTEIAVRAAFKAVQDGKQVAILVPTTLLVQQHFETFSRRYAQFPVKLAALSRFQSDKEVKQVLVGMTDGTIDVVIGTHRLFNPDVRFKDLGLVVVDEEQRFGVEHKEHLKALRTNVDMLTMSATPIPRTLEMAVTGLREMSTIQTPPEERHPVLTTVGPYDEKFITAAIHRELIRDGQVFFVHNRVESINRVASKLGELVPEARIAVAHGQMNEHQLEQIIIDFWAHKYDVLVSTTIIESGLDIPNANTLIVDRADTFGLSQLHQLRGRVGRSRERGYAYFLYAADRPLSENAHDRLSTIAAHTDLGSGMAVAMKDLEIRGAGNLLGGEQSGHIADVGFDLYVRLVSEAVEEVRSGGEATAEVVIKVELPVDAHLPHDYLPDERLRLEAYRRLANARTNDEADQVVEELIDRYGALPKPVAALISIAQLRVLLQSAGITEVIAAGKSVKLSPVELPESRVMRLNRLYPGSSIKPASRTIVVPRTRDEMLGTTQDNSADDLVGWVTALVTSVVLEA